MVRKIVFRRNNIYTLIRDDITDVGFYQKNNLLIYNGRIIDDYIEFYQLIQNELGRISISKERNKKIDQLLNG